MQRHQDQFGRNHTVGRAEPSRVIAARATKPEAAHSRAPSCDLLVLHVHHEVPIDMEEPRPHGVANVGDAVDEGESLLASFCVHCLLNSGVVLVPRIKDGGLSWIPQARGVVPGVPHVEHVMEPRQQQCHGRAACTPRIARKLSEGAGVVHEDHVRKLAWPIVRHALANVGNTGRKQEIYLARPLTAMVLAPIKEDAAT
eukprot:12899043-Heterocapsa_arctica.AAC.4